MFSIPKKVTLPKVNLLDVFIIAQVLVLSFLFFHPSPPSPLPPSVSALSSYQHPPIPEIKAATFPNLPSSSFVLVDVDTNTVLLSKNPDLRIYPASTTKLATALTALNIYPLDEVVSIGQTYSNGKVMDLETSEKITIRSLVTGLLVYSANDAAHTLASHHPSGVNGFVTEMNLIASKYNLRGTHLTNFDGIHSSDHYSTVADLSQLARLSIKNPFLRQIVRTKKTTVTDITGQIQHPLESTNELLDVIPEIEGLKTGWTPEASGSFIGLINLDGHYLISVVAQSQDRFADTRKILDWAKSNLTWQPYFP